MRTQENEFEQATEAVEEQGTDLQSLLSSTIKDSQPSTIQGVVIGVISAIEEGRLFVDFAQNHTGQSLVAAATQVIKQEDIGKEVALLFENGDPQRPIIIGLMFEQSAPLKDELDISVDKERIEFNAEQEIVLKCGKASITLTKAGKILLRGTYLSSRSSGVNRIKGGSIQLN